MLSRMVSVCTCGGFYARLACSSHTKSSQVAFQGRLMWLVNLLIPDLVANDETDDSIHLHSIFLPNDCAFSKIGLLRLQLEKDEPLNIGEFL